MRLSFAKHPARCLWTCLALALAAIAIWSTGRVLRGADEPTEKGAPEKAAPVSFDLPKDAKPAELLKFIAELRKAQPDDVSESGIRSFVVKSRGAMLAAADQILAAQTDDATRLKAIQAKAEALALLNRFGNDDKYAKSCMTSPSSCRRKRIPKLSSSASNSLSKWNCKTSAKARPKARRSCGRK